MPEQRELAQRLVVGQLSLSCQETVLSLYWDSQVAGR